MRDGVPAAYFGRELTPGVRGIVLGRLVLLGVAPAGRSLWSNRRSPVFVGWIGPRAEGGSGLRLAVRRQTSRRFALDTEAEAAFDAWLWQLRSDLGDE
jgi:hypothetical protein